MGTQVSSVAVYFDPGENAGWARFDYGVLVACGIVHPDQFVEIPGVVGISGCDPRRYDVKVTIEDQYIPRQSKQKGDPNDTIVLAHRTGEIGMSIKQFMCSRWGVPVDYKLVLPVTWKGSRPKEVCHGHMLPKLTKTEQGIVGAALVKIKDKSQHLDVKDAVCLGLWDLGRAR